MSTKDTKGNERQTKTSAKSAAEAVHIAESVVTLTDQNKKLETKFTKERVRSYTLLLPLC